MSKAKPKTKMTFKKELHEAKNYSHDDETTNP